MRETKKWTLIGNWAAELDDPHQDDPLIGILPFFSIFQFDDWLAQGLVDESRYFARYTRAPMNAYKQQLAQQAVAHLCLFVGSKGVMIGMWEWANTGLGEPGASEKIQNPKLCRF